MIDHDLVVVVAPIELIKQRINVLSLLFVNALRSLTRRRRPRRYQHADTEPGQEMSQSDV